MGSILNKTFFIQANFLYDKKLFTASKINHVQLDLFAGNVRIESVSLYSRVNIQGLVWYYDMI